MRIRGGLTGVATCGVLVGCAMALVVALTPLIPEASAGLDPTTTALASSANPALSGQSITFTATVGDPSEDSSPTGSVVFDFVDSSVSCQGGTDTETLVGGAAQCTTAMTTSSSGVIVTAQYQGDAVGAPSESSPLTETVGTGSVGVSVTSTAVVAPLAVAGCAVVEGLSSITCPSTAGVTAGAAVTDSAGDLPSGTMVLAVRAGTVSLSASPIGGSASDNLTFVDDPDQTYSSGHPGHFTATVAAVAPATGIPSGTITWSVTSTTGTALACSAGQTVRVAKTTGTASCTVPPGQLMAASGPYAVDATYSGDANFTGGVGIYSQALTSATTKTYLAASPNPPLHGQPVTVSAAVVPSKFGGPPTGGVIFTFTSLPFKVASCGTTLGSEVVHCSGGLLGVGTGYGVSDSTSSATLPPGTTVTGSTSTSVTLSQPAGATLSGQTILFAPNATPTIACTGGNTLSVSGGDASCDVSAGLPLLGSPFGVVASYSGDPSDAGASSHQLNLTAH